MKHAIHHFLYKKRTRPRLLAAALAFASCAFFLLGQAVFPSYAFSIPGPLGRDSKYMILEVYTASGYSHSGVVSCTMYTEDNNGKETRYDTIMLQSLNDQNVSVGNTSVKRFENITRLEITAKSASTSSPWRPASFRLIQSDEAPKTYYCAYPDTTAKRYEGTAVLEYRSTGYQFRSPDPVSFYTKPANSMQEQTKLNVIQEPVSASPAYLAVSIQSSGEPGAGLDPEGLAALSGKRTKNNNARELLFHLSYTDTNGMPRSYQYYP